MSGIRIIVTVFYCFFLCIQTGWTDFDNGTDLSTTGVSKGSIGLGDLENDGDLDIIISGWSGTINISVRHFSHYLNNGNGTFTGPIAFDENIVGSLVVGDIDNDNDIDFCIAGKGSISGKCFKCYKNIGIDGWNNWESVF